MPNNKRKITPIYADDPYWAGQETTGSLANPLNADRYGRGLFQGRYIQGGEGSYYGQGVSSMDKRVRQSPYTQGTTMEVPGYVEDKRHPYDAPEYNREFYRAQDRKPVIEDTPISDFFFSKAVAADVIDDAPVQYDEMGNIISSTDVINTSQARAFDPQSIRNVRNNNPGNIKINKANDWKGRVSNLSDKTFESFQTPEYGVRALNKVVNANIKATNTFDEFVNRYASEPKEKEYFKKNGKLMPHLQNYANSLARSQGLTSSSSKFPKNIDKKAWLRAIIRHEGGQEALTYYTDDVLSRGINLK